MEIEPSITRTTLEAVDLALEMNQEQGNRNYLGFSEIGDKCSRKLWYGYNKFEKKPFTANTLKKFDDGNRGEDIMAARIKAAGIKIWGTQSEFVLGKFKGHCDGFIIPLENPIEHVWEHKSTEKPPKEDTLLKDWNYQYYCQALMYMYASGVHNHYMTISTAGERHTIALFTEYNPLLVEELLQKAEYIIGTKTPPDKISNTPAFYHCKYMCSFREVCFAN